MAAEPRPAGGIGAALASANAHARHSLLRGHGGGHAPVSTLELFFDLVFVFAITQLSHFLHHHMGLLGLIEGVVLFLALWWAWIYTAWVTNWADPDRLPMRLLLLALMLLSLGMATAIPTAFAGQGSGQGPGQGPGQGLAFAACYIALQLGRSLTMAWLFRADGCDRMRNMLRISAWFALSAPLWIGGALLDGGARIALWLAALGIEYAGPMTMFPVPGLGRSKLSDWDISGSHMAERCALFIIIALGEGIVVTGSSFSGAAPSPGLIAALVTAFLGSGLMWWLYFDLGAERGARLMAGHAQVGRIARNAYTYLHMPIVLGIVIWAVADALLLEQFAGPASRELVLYQTGGALLFIGGLALFKRFANTFGNFPLSHGVALVLFAALGLWGWLVPVGAVPFAALGVVILVLTAVWEWVSYRGGWVERMAARGWRAALWMQARTERRRAEREAAGG